MKREGPLFGGGVVVLCFVTWVVLRGFLDAVTRLAGFMAIKEWELANGSSPLEGSLGIYYYEATTLQAALCKGATYY